VDAETMTTALLWTMAVLGAWNGINMAARIYYRAPWNPYAWHVFSGSCAAMILWMR
jgi:hypothetical protein